MSAGWEIGINHSDKAEEIGRGYIVTQAFSELENSMRNNRLILFGILFLFTFCNPEKDPVELSGDYLTGEWDATQYALYLNNSEIVFIQEYPEYPVELLKKNAQGILLKANGQFCHRYLDSNLGWHTCQGNNFSGAWSLDVVNRQITFNILPNSLIEASVLEETKNSFRIKYFIEPYYFEFRFRRH